MKNLDIIREFIEKVDNSNVLRVFIKDGDFELEIESQRKDIIYSDSNINKNLDIIREFIEKVDNSNVLRVFIKDGDFELEIESQRKDIIYSDSNINTESINLNPINSNKVEIDDSKSNNDNENVSSNIVKSPIVGTFYASPSPDKEPFVSIGKNVCKGDTLFIVESMKLMNEIKSEFDGVVTEILVKNGDPVEYGQSIIIIE